MSGRQGSRRRSANRGARRPLATGVVVGGGGGGRPSPPVAKAGTPCSPSPRVARAGTGRRELEGVVRGRGREEEGDGG